MTTKWQNRRRRRRAALQLAHPGFQTFRHWMTRKWLKNSGLTELTIAPSAAQGGSTIKATPQQSEIRASRYLNQTRFTEQR